MVGCVLVHDGRVVGEGYHRRFGQDHAEVEALRRAGGAARGATAYVTLEPCNHFGKTPPCTEALAAAGIGEVVAAMRDPNPIVAGKGLRALRRAGIRVRQGLLRKDAEALNAPYLKLVKRKCPYVIAKWAQSIDGKIATRRGESKWISSAASRRLVHRLRSRVDGIMVGSQTVLTDDPLLTARGVLIRRAARRIVLDTRLRTPLDCRLVRSARKTPTLIFTSSTRSRSSQAERLRKAGVDVHATAVRGRHVSLKAVLEKLGRMQMSNVLMEGGGELLGAAFDAGLVDEAYVFVAPLLIGGNTVAGPLGGKGAAEVRGIKQFRLAGIRRVGRDTLYNFRNHRAGSQRAGTSSATRLRLCSLP